ncbi:arginine--tRNA ligase, partial [bacterium]|nr:arginine--tRNA ligase [bacterium]
NGILEQGASYGGSDRGRDKKILIEYSAPNTNKPQHLGHVRNNILGMTISNILQKAGGTVTRINLINDRGIHICKSMLAYKKWGSDATPESAGKKGDHFVGEYYVLFEQKVKKDENLINEAQGMLKKWEDGDSETVALWKKMNGWVYDGFSETYKRLGVEFDTTYYESDTYKLGKDIVLKALEEKKCFRNEKGDIVIDLSEKNLGMKVLLRGDGTSIYITQDIGNAKLRFDEYDINSSIYVVASEQNHHFQVLFEILRQFGYEWADKCYHLSYGMVYLPEGKMKSREGTVVDADNLMNELKLLAQEEVKKREREIDDVDKISEQIGIAAVKYYILKVHPTKDINFNPEESISFEGDTGPYVQYTHARISSLLRKSNEVEDCGPGFSKIGNDEEVEVVKHLLLFQRVIESSAEKYNPSLMAAYVIELAKRFNKFYHDHSVLNTGDDELMQGRVALSRAVGIVIKEGLRVLGIYAPEKM